ncbi:P-loop containing nucleoside triphosphate hydrolase protein [Boeremia exigua]|uniref:P-loop containing nucleoside triphosphate hydrolase protein n=1 Tax=Boeremia exigua TaxID=749465 RepID=UPI001E8D50F9|nr:P-loop containing nucleoside triphosphate hydrolase protein [Boeremia exigua]KAH6618618.1 P-loop containing nucleoside triphosphate hydrolase protein [Boeremia exigua]
MVCAPPSCSVSCTNPPHDDATSSGSSKDYPTTVSTPHTSISSCAEEEVFDELKHYIALGCVHLEHPVPLQVNVTPNLDSAWSEVLRSQLPEEIRSIIGIQASQLLDARWIRLFLFCSPSQTLRSIARVYLLPEDWSRRSISRSGSTLKKALRHLLHQIDTSPNAWNADLSDAQVQPFDLWAGGLDTSLYYLFNKLPSPAPDPAKIKNRYTRRAAYDLLGSAQASEWEDDGQQPLKGLRTRLYPYQARSASLMLEREAAPQLQLDPRLETRISPNGDKYLYCARDGSFLQDQRFYESNRGGILAETMGLGKTIICLALILASQGHYPQIPEMFRQPLPMRARVGTLKEMAANVPGRYAIPDKVCLEDMAQHADVNVPRLQAVLDSNVPFYEIPPELPRMNRATKIPPPRQYAMCSGTLLVVPKNLLHQWQSEIRKHLLPQALKILVVDTVSKRNQTKIPSSDSAGFDFTSELPAPTELMKYDVILFTRTRFEQEIQDGTDKQGRRYAAGVSRSCICPYIGATRIPDCNCFGSGTVYESPLLKLHWLRIIIDEGHNFSSATSNAVLVAKQILVERRWVVSGTPAKDLVGVEVDMSTMDVNDEHPTLLRDSVIEQRKTFNITDESKAVKALGSLASNYLMVRPWCASSAEGGIEWDEYVYRHEHSHRKTYSSFSSCFQRALEGLVVKTRPEDVEKDIVLPPLKHNVVYLQPCWFDKMTANLFIQVLRANAITSERSDVDYLFHPNSIKPRHTLIRNLRQSNFTWTGFSVKHVVDTLETTTKYLSKDDRKCSLEDARSLLESSQAVASLPATPDWVALSTAHEVGFAVEAWPVESEKYFAFAYPEKPTMVGLTQLLEGQLHIDSNVRSDDPAKDLALIGGAGKARISAMTEAEQQFKLPDNDASNDESMLTKSGIPRDLIQPLSSRRTSILASKAPPAKTIDSESTDAPEPMTPLPARLRKRKITPDDELAMLPPCSPLLDTRIVGTTSAKLTYLIDKVVEHQATKKIIIFYDGDNAAFYIAQSLEALYVNHRIYARQLDNTKRSEYVRLFNEDDSVRVLLIDVACGALGLNLNAASIILIVNPINRPGLEAQAIKRAHRIGQTKEVLVETLVLEHTIEHAIFERAKKMSRAQHSEAKELEDDAGITEIIQNAQILPASSNEQGLSKFALLTAPQQLFGRPNRDKYHRFQVSTPEKSRKRVKTSKRTTPSKGSGASTPIVIGDGDGATYRPAIAQPSSGLLGEHV